ncbi:MAG: ribonuclease HII [Acidobacteria bacterium]|nr:ribonuclease HII [Acidobacteriota bacterium]
MKSEILSKLSLADIRRRFIEQGEPTSSRLLLQMYKDPRLGVRRVYEVLRKRKDAERHELQRLDAMLHFERLLWKSGILYIAGVDEVGIGPLAGPVVSAAVVFPPYVRIDGINDSKRLDPQQRCTLAVRIRECATGIGVGVAEVSEIDELNIYHAGLLAMRRAVKNLPLCPQHVLTDAREIPELEVPQNRFFKGDGLNFSIAAASIIAKVFRDQQMDELDREHPQYGFRENKGYSTPRHLKAICKFGPSPIHRLSFGCIKELCGEWSPSFYLWKSNIYRAESVRELDKLEEKITRSRRLLTEAEYRKLRLILSRRWKHVGV